MLLATKKSLLHDFINGISLLDDRKYPKLTVFLLGCTEDGYRTSAGSWYFQGALRFDIKTTRNNGMGMIVVLKIIGALHKTQCIIYCCVLLSKQKKKEELVLKKILLLVFLNLLYMTVEKYC